MNLPLPVHRIVEEWLLWATWQSDSTNSGKQNDDLIGFDEFDWVVRSHPEHAWECILATVKDSRSKPFLGLLAAGPMEDLLSFHGPVFIERVENEAKINPAFASMLGGVWRFQMSFDIWSRVQAVWDRRGWDGNPE
jgi:hypothetical protein